MGDYSLFGESSVEARKSLWPNQACVSHNTDYRAQPVPSLHILWKKSEQMQFRFNYARGFRAPSIKELHIEFIDANHNIVGNPDLRAEYAHHLDLSAERTLKDKRSVHALNKAELVLQPPFQSDRTGIGRSGAVQLCECEPDTDRRHGDRHVVHHPPRFQL